MSKELPYFKFIPTEFLLGTINFQKEKIQGTFINVCCHYWQRHCDLTLNLLNQLLSKSQANVKHLIECDIVKHDTKTDKINIDFLDEQWVDLTKLHEKRSRAGSIGGKANVKQTLSNYKRLPKHLDKDKIEIKNKIEIKKETIELFDSLKFFYGFDSEQRHISKWFEINAFLNSLDDIEYFKIQFNNYKKYKSESKEKIHSFQSFISGGWDSENWEKKYIDFQKTNPDNWKSQLSKIPPPLKEKTNV